MDGLRRRVERDEASNWATPYIWESDRGAEIITPGTRKVRSYDLHGHLLTEILDIVRQNKRFLEEKWHEYFRDQA